jgi:hypothetical protein
MSANVAVDARLAAIAVTQGGVFTRAQATGAGLGAKQIERRVRAGVWHRMLPGVYRHAGAPVSGGAQQWAVILWAGPGSALSHTTAAAIWRVPVPPAPFPEVLLPATRAPRRAGVTVHRTTRLRAVDVVRVHGLPVTTPVRTIVDLAAVLAAADLRVALEHAFARGLVTVRAVGTGLDEIGSVGRPGSARLRMLLTGFGSGTVRPSARMAG